MTVILGFAVREGMVRVRRIPFGNGN
jgi:hypothetical protein